ncbi:hypothetical protein BDP81DRAFT_415128 [Colletotrichum phormii]|uniref:Uncharacterized protein n=1 Tax=Colletotrichum phormii TaxID=359342 RepID=A0AAJ0EK34_9PEZI|nr:uncharacterized protein BDP81DRAFT_415128 [Colletotrichum phormii]KAK1654167.1 hypothetical protein BDP81DRAFT_415128 [Colletotrichum phormii]
MISITSEGFRRKNSTRRAPRNRLLSLGQPEPPVTRRDLPKSGHDKGRQHAKCITKWLLFCRLILTYHSLLSNKDPSLSSVESKTLLRRQGTNPCVNRASRLALHSGPWETGPHGKHVMLRKVTHCNDAFSFLVRSISWEKTLPCVTNSLGGSDALNSNNRAQGEYSKSRREQQPLPRRGYEMLFPKPQSCHSCFVCVEPSFCPFRHFYLLLEQPTARIGGGRR